MKKIFLISITATLLVIIGGSSAFSEDQKTNWIQTDFSGGASSQIHTITSWGTDGWNKYASSNNIEFTGPNSFHLIDLNNDGELVSSILYANGLAFDLYSGDEFRFGSSLDQLSGWYTPTPSQNLCGNQLIYFQIKQIFKRGFAGPWTASLSAMPLSHVFSGQVLDSGGQPIIGASVKSENKVSYLTGGPAFSGDKVYGIWSLAVWLFPMDKQIFSFKAKLNINNQNS